MPRSKLVDVAVTRFYHCISRCVRQATLLAKGKGRKVWIEHRLQLLCRCFGVQIAGFAILDNHLHCLVRLCPEDIDGCSDEQIVRRWGQLFPPKGKRGEPQKLTAAWVAENLAKPGWVETIRERLKDLGWFMKCLKEPLAKKANREDDCRGAFWEGRYKSIAILDEESLLATAAYIDLNPFAAGCFKLPEEAPFTSLRARLQHCESLGRLADLQQARYGSAAATAAASGMEDGLWLFPLEDRRQTDAEKAGILAGFTLGTYLQLVDYTSRLFRDGKARVAAHIPPILDRLGINASRWSTVMKALARNPRPVGVAFAASKQRLLAEAARRGVRRVANLNACPTLPP